ncbi:MAG: hypothetical protein IPL46_13865 [Saprospiraceae bacterium]|nr:hypothetical protein [Saprospiraceae bacterium]
MKTNFFALILMVAIIACNKEDNLTENYENTSMSWTVGADHSGDTTVILPTSKAQMNYLSVKEYSICPNTRLQIIVTSGDQVVLDSIYQDKFEKYPLPNQAGKNLEVQTKLIAGDSLVLCVWLGQATLKYEYVE